MYVTKQDGRREPVHFDKITARIKKLCYGLNPDFVDECEVSKKVCNGVFKGVTTAELDELASETAVHMGSKHPDYQVLAARIAVSRLHKKTTKLFSEVMLSLLNHVDPKTGVAAPRVSQKLYDTVAANRDSLDSAVVYERDNDYDFFGFMTLKKSYLLMMQGDPVERPQHMLMRVAVGIHGNDVAAALETYNLMSNGWFTHATPTLYNAGTPNPQMSSCYLLTINDDSIEGIYKTMAQCAVISKWAGGIGLSVHNVRAKGSYIKRTGGESNGIVPMLRCFNNTARYVDQCFAPDTIVYTQRGPIPIHRVTIADSVLNSGGTFSRVNQLLRHDYDGPILNIKVKQGIRNVQVTPKHQVLALKGQDGMLNFATIRNRLDKGYAQATMVDANELQVGDFVCFPVPDASTVTDIPSLSIDDCRFYGLLVGDGWIEEGRNGSGLSFGSSYGEKVRLQVFVREYCARRGIRITTEDSRPATNNTRMVWNTNNVGFRFNREQLYNAVDGDKIIDPAFLQLPREKLLAIIQGVFEADGSILKEECTPLEMASVHVIEAVRWMLMRCEILSSGYHRNRVGNDVSSYNSTEETQKETDVLRIPRVPVICDVLLSAPKGEYTSSYLVHDGIMYSRITAITQSDYTGGTTHDFEVEGDHTYVTELGTVHNGGGKRKGAFAIYLEPWHADIFEFLQLKKNHGKEEDRARDLFYALWTCDLFMERVEADNDWSLFCPAEAPGLFDVWGEDFNHLYRSYEATPGLARRTLKARELWQAILTSQTETGTPYMMYKDACNRKSNQQHLGTIRSSNLCTEIVQYTSPDEIAVCNLASVALPKFVVSSSSSKKKKKTFDHQKLFDVMQVVTRNLNRVIDENFYPVKEARTSNTRHRPIGIGVQGLATMFARLDLPFTSPAAKKLNRDIFETMYFASLTASIDLARQDGPYETYPGSPMSRGILQPDMWNVDLTDDRWNWTKLRLDLAKYGARNSLLLAPMPTASSAQILGNSPAFEPFSSMLELQRTKAGEFPVVCRPLVESLVERGLWNSALKNEIVANNGSVQGLAKIPDDLQEMYKTAYELKGRDLIDMAADRGAFIDQSQSFNVFMSNVTKQKLDAMHFYGWKAGLKTGLYYLRTKAAVDAIKFTVDGKTLRDRNDAAAAKLLAANQVKGQEQVQGQVKGKVQGRDQEQLLQQLIEVQTQPLAAVVGEVCTMEDGCTSCGC